MDCWQTDIVYTRLKKIRRDMFVRHKRCHVGEFSAHTLLKYDERSYYYNNIQLLFPENILLNKIYDYY